MFIGHGTYDGRESKFNLRGPDVNSVEIGEWLKPFTGELVAIDGASANAPFLHALSGKDRIIISATKSADEVFYTRFGEFFAKAIGGALPEVDLDRDGQVSVLEAFLWSSKQVERFFEGRLATEQLPSSTTTATASARPRAGSTACAASRPPRKMPSPTAHAPARSPSS